MIPDSGTRTNFNTGAVRDAAPGKGLPSMIPFIAIRKMAARFEEGARKYGPRNWMKGIPLSRYFDALWRHSMQAAEGDESEDHLGAVLWNAAAWAWTYEQIKLGKLPRELMDLPYHPECYNPDEEKAKASKVVVEVGFIRWLWRKIW